MEKLLGTMPSSPSLKAEVLTIKASGREATDFKTKVHEERQMTIIDIKIRI
jgi:hypothetical protein